MASANTHDFLGIAAEELLGKRITDVLGIDAAQLEDRVQDLTSKPIQSFLLECHGQEFMAVLHRNKSNRIILELEIYESNSPEKNQQIYQSVLESIDALENCATLQNLFDMVAEKVRFFIGHYRFDSDWHGHVVEYLQNMKVGASMSISILKDGELWGLIACHHATAKHVSYQVRSFCKLMSFTFSTQLVSKEQHQTSEQEKRSAESQQFLFERLLRATDPIAELPNYVAEIMDFVPSSGAAIWIEGKLATAGDTPSENQIEDLVSWYSTELNQSHFQTNQLSESLPSAINYSDVASGILLIKISPVRNHFVIWFRPEQIRSVKWGGNPEDKLTSVDHTGQVRLIPRKSFEQWSQEVRNSSSVWTLSDINSALRLRSNLVDVVLRRVHELEQLNFRLEKSNLELDAFAYIASHDLKEPLRGISGYVSMILKRYAEKVGDDGTKKLETVINLTKRLETLLDSLMDFSRVGQLKLKLETLDLNEIINEVCQGLHQKIEDENGEINIVNNLPSVTADRVQLTQVFSNLISNALKYNESPTKKIEIGAEQDEKGLVLFVRDNGIGISKSYQEAVFQIFKRLHNKSEFGGGAGAGLTIVRKIIERHKGDIWIESTPDQGTTFYFTICGERNSARINA